MSDFATVVPARMDSGSGSRSGAVPAAVLNPIIASVYNLYATIGEAITPSRASRVARRSLRARAWMIDVQNLESGLLPTTYADPTGDTAVWNVLTGGEAR